MQVYLALIFAFAGNFAPYGSAFCDGRLMSIAQNTALFSLIGTYFGGNGVQNFGLPDLRGRMPIGQGQGPGLSPYVIGEGGGTQSTTILQTNLPQHTHSLNVNNGTGTTGVPINTTVLSKGPVTGSGPTAEVGKIYTTAAPNVPLSPTSIGLTGSNIPISIMQPYLAVTYFITLVGIFPARN